MSEHIVDYVEIVLDDNKQYRVRGRSNNGEIIWTSEQYEDLVWARKVANDTGKEVHEHIPVLAEEYDKENLDEDVDGTPTTSIQRPDPAE